MAEFVLEGIVAAPFLPMKPDFSIHWDDLGRYIAWVAAQRPTAIAMNMDASEGPALTRDEQLEILAVCKTAIAGRTRLLSGLIAGSTAECSWSSRAMFCATVSELKSAPD